MISELAKSLMSGDLTAKPINHWKIYDLLFDRFSVGEVKRIVEVGVHRGESSRILSEYFNRADLLGLDQNLQHLIPPFPKNVSFQLADQRDANSLVRQIETHFTGQAVDLIIDDASHVGLLTKNTFVSCFQKLRSGGLYVIEDWGTGYWDSWPDGSRFEEYNLSGGFSSHFPRRFPSHDFGMVGFVKSLVDFTHEEAIKINERDTPKRTSRASEVSFHEGIVAIWKK